MRTIADSTVDTILKWMRTCFLPATSRHRRWLPLTSTAASRAMSGDEPADYLVGLICFMFELVYPASRALTRKQGDICRLLDAPFGIVRPFTDRHASDLGTPKERDASLAGQRLALELGQKLLDNFDGVTDNFVLRSAEDGGIRGPR